jgi:glycosyltransferase involved in cell wall biosynthesis
LKGFDVGVRSFAALLKVIPRGIEIKYIVVGTGSDDAALRTLVDQLGIATFVEFKGWVSQRELGEIYCSADVFLHPAWFEPYGVVVVEALLSGLYAVCSDQTGAAVELVQPGINGNLFTCGDEAEITEQLRQAMLLKSSGRLDREQIRAKSLKWPLDYGVEVAYLACHPS